MAWSERWERMDPERVMIRKQEQQQRQHARSAKGRAERARQGLEQVFKGEDMGQPMRTDIAAEPLFTSAHAALVFAFNFNMQQYDRPLMNKLAGTPAGGGKGLSGIDGAAQAGMIRAELDRLNPIRKAMVTASIAPRQVYAGKSDPGKGEWRPNPEWQTAIMTISWDMASSALSGCISNRALRAGIVARCFGAKVNLSELAEYCEVAQNTATNHYQRIRNYLNGTRGGSGTEPIIGEVRRAMDDIERRLLAAEIIEGN